MVVKSQSQSRSSFGSLAAAGAIAAIIAAVADVVVYSIARASGVSMVFGLLVKFTLRGMRVFQIVSVPALLVSFAGPLSLAQTAGSTKAALVAMHIVAAAGMVAALSLLGRPVQNG